VKAGGLEAFLPKLGDIVFHEKLGTVADKVERVAKLARWLVESGAIPAPDAISINEPSVADLAEQAARLCKADLVSATVGEFPEVQGIAGAYLARGAGLDPRVADAVRDHYKPVGQGDEVPTAPVSVAVALADKLDTLLGFFCNDLKPTSSRDPFSLRRAGLGSIAIITKNNISASLLSLLEAHSDEFFEEIRIESMPFYQFNMVVESFRTRDKNFNVLEDDGVLWMTHGDNKIAQISKRLFTDPISSEDQVGRAISGMFDLEEFLIERLKVQQREAGVRHDLIDAVFALGGEDDLVRLLARVRALQSVLATDDGTNLLAGVKRAANILRIEEGKNGDGGEAFAPESDASLFTEPAETALGAALDSAVPAIAAAVAAEDFTAAMAALAGLRPAVDAFFEGVIVNAPDPKLRANRLGLLARLRAAAYSVADFSKVEG
jgi:glycyl-tRNA synthetase beta chain